MRFKDIPAREGIKERLRSLHDTGKLPHALLLEGPSGGYKLALARAFAQYIHCQNHTSDGDSCGVCPSCIQHASMNHIDTIYVYPVVKTEKIKEPVSDDYAELWRRFADECPTADIDTWTVMLDKPNARPIIYVYESRELVHKLSLTAHNARYRIIILWLPERLNEEASNKLLKLVEEPFPDTLFLMVSDSPRDILPTIYSRCQRVEVPRLADDVLSSMLVQKHGIDPVEAQAVAHIAEGDANEALRLIQVAGEGEKMHEMFVKLMRLAYMRNVADLKAWAASLADEGREWEIKFYENAQRLVRENFVYNFGISELNYMTRAEGEFSVRFARFITEGNVEQLVNLFNRARTDIFANGNGKIINFDVALKVCFLLKHGQ